MIKRRLGFAGILLAGLILVLYLTGGGKIFGRLGVSRCEKLWKESEEVMVEGEVYQKTRKEEKLILYLKKIQIREMGNGKAVADERLLVYLDEKGNGPEIGQRILVKGNVGFFDPAANPGNFDQKNYYKQQNIQAVLWKGKVLEKQVKKTSFREKLWQFRNRTADEICREMGKRRGGILCAVLLGDSFYTEEKAEALAKELGIDPLKTADVMIGSRGNWREIEKFLRDTPSDKRPMAMDLLNVISAKDLRDTPASVLADHLNNAQAVQSSLFTEYILNPRVANEFLTPYRKFFAANVDPMLVKKAKADPQLIVDWVKENISINDSLNPQRIPIMPMGVWKSRVADKGSRNIFFVAVCRSIGIPARIEPVAGKVQYAKGLNWVDVDFEAAEQTIAKQGKVVASYLPIKALQDPKYYSHFTIAKVLPTGKLQTLNFESGDVDMGGGDTWSALLKKPLSMDEGHYMLVTGTRMANGSVLAEISFFNVEPGKTSNIKLEMRESQDDVQVIGNFNSENKFKRADNGEETSLLATTGRGYYIVAVLGARQEPTNHAMRDIAAVKKELEEWGRGMVLLFPDEKGFQNFDPKEFGELPSTITYGIDIDKTIQKEIAAAMKLQNGNTLPIFIIADTFNRVVFVSQGYTIGLGDQLMKVIHKL